MANETYVVIRPNGLGAMVFKNHSDPISLAKYGEVLKNPDISHVKGISPSFWKLTENGIREMSQDEKSRSIDNSEAIKKISISNKEYVELGSFNSFVEFYGKSSKENANEHIKIAGSIDKMKKNFLAFSLLHDELEDRLSKQIKWIYLSLILIGLATVWLGLKSEGILIWDTLLRIF